MIENNVNRNKRAVFGWTMFDWANSVHSLVITSTIFPIYFAAVSMDPGVAISTIKDAKGVPMEAIVPFMGMELKSISMIAIAVAIGYFFITLVSPILGAIADYSGNKRKFMMFFATLGATACGLLFFFDASNYYLGFWLYVIALVGYAGGVIFNDAFLPEVAAPEDYDKVSARGYVMGYIGSVILLLFNLSMVMMPSFYFDVAGKAAELMAANPGMDFKVATEAASDFFSGPAARISFLTVGIWWFGFSLITFFTLKDVKPGNPSGNILSQGFRELGLVREKLKKLLLLKRFLLAFFFYNMGLQTVMYLAASFGKVELNMEASQLIISVLLIQIVAIPGSLFFASLSRKFGNYKALLVGIFIWILICIGAYFVQDANGFYVIGATVGLVMGGMQALSRSTYSKLVPKGIDNASFFSFYSITDKISVMAGTFSFGIISQTMGTRNSVIALTLFFAIGGSLIYWISKSNPHSESQK